MSQGNQTTATNEPPALSAGARQSRAARGHILFFFAVMLSLALAWKLRAVLELVYVSALFAVVLMPLVQATMRISIRKWSAESKKYTQMS